MFSNILILGILINFCSIDSDRYEISKSTLSFDSDAPLELINATTNDVKGLLDIESNAFAFLIPITSFQGFNSSLQREHFNENYLESSKYKNGKFSGHIEGNFDLETYGDYNVIANGKMKIHGIDADYKIPVLIHVDDYGIKITSKFNLKIEDFNIKVPTIMFMKIAKVIFVDFEATLEKKY